MKRASKHSLLIPPAWDISQTQALLDVHFKMDYMHLGPKLAPFRNGPSLQIV